MNSWAVDYKKIYDNILICGNSVHKIKYPDKIVNAFKKQKPFIVEKFKQRSLQFGESLLDKLWPEYYIDHFRIGSWKQQ